MLTLVIQAGGESRRMGQDKALAPFLGQTLIQQVLQRLAGLTSQVIVTTNKPDDYAFLGVPLAPDILPGRGALGGLYTALSAASQPLVAVVACDMPFASPALLAYFRDLLSDPRLDAAIPRTPGGSEPFHAVYRRETCLPPVQAAIEADLWRVDAWFPQVHIHFSDPQETQRFDPRQVAFWNVNTPEELRQAEDMGM